MKLASPGIKRRLAVSNILPRLVACRRQRLSVERIGDTCHQQYKIHQKKYRANTSTPFNESNPTSGAERQTLITDREPQKLKIKIPGEINRLRATEVDLQCRTSTLILNKGRLYCRLSTSYNSKQRKSAKPWKDSCSSGNLSKETDEQVEIHRPIHKTPQTPEKLITQITSEVHDPVIQLLTKH